MEEQKINQVLTIVNQGLANIEEITLVQSENPNGPTLRFKADAAAIEVIEGLLAQCELNNLFFDIAGVTTWHLDKFYETNPRSETNYVSAV